MFVVVAYDISDDKRRNKVCEILEHYGTRVNYSVFECNITRRQVSLIKRDLEKILVAKEDDVIYYYLCNVCKEKKEVHGRNSAKIDGGDNKVVVV